MTLKEKIDKILEIVSKIHLPKYNVGDIITVHKSYGFRYTVEFEDGFIFSFEEHHLC